MILSLSGLYSKRFGSKKIFEVRAACHHIQYLQHSQLVSYINLIFRNNLQNYNKSQVTSVHCEAIPVNAYKRLPNQILHIEKVVILKLP